MKLFLFTDGASRNNPWKSGAGWIAYDENKKVIFIWKKYLWIKTNNQAEYSALLEWIKESVSKNPSEINIFLDSELIVKQLNKEYKVKNKDLKKLFEEVLWLLSGQNWSAKHVRRELNKDADRLANEAIDWENGKI